MSCLGWGTYTHEYGQKMHSPRDHFHAGIDITKTQPLLDAVTGLESLGLGTYSYLK